MDWHPTVKEAFVIFFLYFLFSAKKSSASEQQQKSYNTFLDEGCTKLILKYIYVSMCI